MKRFTRNEIENIALRYSYDKKFLTQKIAK